MILHKLSKLVDGAHDPSPMHGKCFKWMVFMQRLFGDAKLKLVCYPQLDGSVFFEYKESTAQYYLRVYPDGRMEGNWEPKGLKSIYD